MVIVLVMTALKKESLIEHRLKNKQKHIIILFSI